MNWIKTSEKLPEHEQWLLFIDIYNDRQFGYFIKYKDMWKGRFEVNACGCPDSCGTSYPEDEIKYWQPYPELPEDLR